MGEKENISIKEVVDQFTLQVEEYGKLFKIEPKARVVCTLTVE
jgi:hypothetical protein